MQLPQHSCACVQVTASTPLHISSLTRCSLPAPRRCHACRSYMVDTGIRFSHEEFLTQAGGATVRALPAFSAFGDNNSSDCNGHGTHTAATVGGLTYGVAKNVTLWAVRAMDCLGNAQLSQILEVPRRGGQAGRMPRACAATASDAAASKKIQRLTRKGTVPPCIPCTHPSHPPPPQAFEWVAENAVQPAAISMSVAGNISPAVNEAARRLVQDHLVTMVVAAGNSYEPACLMSPASSPWVISVAASDEQDSRWAQSNW